MIKSLNIFCKIGQKFEFSILIDNKERLNFFIKILKNKNNTFYTPDIKDVCFLHTRLSSYLFGVRYCIGKHYLLTANSKKYKFVVPCIESSIRGKIFFGSKDDKYSQSRLIFNELWIFNGFQYSASLIKMATMVGNIRYFEISNFPDTYQSNISGINADMLIDGPKSSDCNKELLERARLKLNKPVEGVKIQILKKIFYHLVDEFGFIFFKTISPREGLFSKFCRYVGAKKSRRLINLYSSSSFPDTYQIFLGQVENDSQGVFQSEETQLSALKKAFKSSQKDGFQLVYRPHPKETNHISLRGILNFCINNGVIVHSAGSLFSSLVNAEKIYTVNSTAGAQAILFGKDVKVFGRAFYKGWDKWQVCSYYYNILHHL